MSNSSHLEWRMGLLDRNLTGNTPPMCSWIGFSSFREEALNVKLYDVQWTDDWQQMDAKWWEMLTWPWTVIVQKYMEWYKTCKRVLLPCTILHNKIDYLYEKSLSIPLNICSNVILIIYTVNKMFNIEFNIFLVLKLQIFLRFWKTNLLNLICVI